jgi:signal transduction histidine kinase
MRRLSQISSRNILIIFLALTALFLAQMSWWIIFQVRQTNQTVDILSQYVQPGNPVLAQIEDEGRRHVKMLVMEGSFFVALIMLGAYAIYLSLARSRRVREEQLLFVHSVTHELKIPLTSISLFLDTMRRRNYESKIVSELAPKMKEDVARLSGLIDNILLVRKIADKEVETKLDIIDLSAELGRFAAGINERIVSTGGALKTRIEDGIRVKADLPELVKVWETVVDNSVKYRKEGSLALSIILRRVNGEAEIQFLDNGPGIPVGMGKELFEPFVRANHDARKSVPGSGLGLYIAREYVTRSKGNISIRNASAGGCLVTIKFEAIK